jgi:uncharacterized protein
MIYFEWDDRKAILNLAKHGVSFEMAKEVFHDTDAVDFEDRTMDYGELRRRIIGVGGGVFLMVAYTDRGEAIRIISARRATKVERRFYENNQW